MSMVLLQFLQSTSRGVYPIITFMGILVNIILLMLEKSNCICELEYGDSNKCRWNVTPSSPLLYVKYDINKLNVLDVEKGIFILQQGYEFDGGNNRE